MYKKLTHTHTNKQTNKQTPQSHKPAGTADSAVAAGKYVVVGVLVSHQALLHDHTEVLAGAVLVPVVP
jgi:hypothetical protein